MLWSDFEDTIATILEHRKEESEAASVNAAFVGWQFGASGKSWNEYLRLLGLGKKEQPRQLTEEQIRQEAEKALRKAERIARLDR